MGARVGFFFVFWLVGFFVVGGGLLGFLGWGTELRKIQSFAWHAFWTSNKDANLDMSLIPRTVVRVGHINLGVVSQDQYMLEFAGQ